MSAHGEARREPARRHNALTRVEADGAIGARRPLVEALAVERAYTRDVQPQPNRRVLAERRDALGRLQLPAGGDLTRRRRDVFGTLSHP